MSKTLTLRGVEIGAGIPKIIVPIVGKTDAEIMEKAKVIADMRVDVVEWRVDFYDEVFDSARTLATLAKLRQILGDKAIIFTFRTDREGGEKAISAADYTKLNTLVAQSGNADLVDVEIFSGDDVVKQNIEAIHAAGCKVIGSNHDFHKTPAREDIVSRLRKMQDMGADIPKIAVMPTCTADVLTLLAATSEMYEQYADRPIITMSMSAKGVISRLSCEAFGSAMTFGAVGQVSAPGQIPVEQLREVLTILHNSL